MDDKQRHPGFDYYEYDMPKFGTTGPGFAQRSLDRSKVAALTSKNTPRILNTIKPVTRVFTAMDRVKLAIIIGIPQKSSITLPCTTGSAKADASQITSRRPGDKLKSESAYQMRELID